MRRYALWVNAVLNGLRNEAPSGRSVRQWQLTIHPLLPFELIDVPLRRASNDGSGLAACLLRRVGLGTPPLWL